MADVPPRFGVKWTSDDMWLEVVDNLLGGVVARLYWPTFAAANKTDVFDLWSLGVLIAERYEDAATKP